ncbi:general secretion pathway protein GspN [Asaia krungthepensis]|uniref:Uncharacterized protein n=1 Tax=Asaia krungthepensis NRIC 0535 TaxID=1307925 RepID=A0ABQ0Q267_9PROT|nr:general secretion pathway protein GspN [Asaia krungthepensis]GBQ87719.1 hypothetical protein AA0535_1351 [Asaia krungthepensis NRIC 0535]
MMRPAKTDRTAPRAWGSIPYLSIAALLLTSLPGPALGAASADPAIQGAARSDELATILARPLFAPSRRPALSPDRVEGTPRLAGIIESEGKASAIFMLPGRERGVIVPIRGTMGNWQIVSIGGGAVTIRENGQDRILRPDRDRQSTHPANAPSLDFAPPVSSESFPPGMPQ